MMTVIRISPAHPESKRLAFLLAVVLLAALPAPAQEQPSSFGEAATVDAAFVRVPRTKTPPTIDGVINQEEWSDAAGFSAFWRDSGGAGFIHLAPRDVQNKAYLMYDAANLYVAAVYPVYPQGAWLRARGRFPNVLQHPQYGVLWDDHVEFELRPYHDAAEGFNRGLLRWDVNSLNTVADWTWSLTQGGYDMTWQSRATARSNLDKDNWTVEFAIPFESLRAVGYAGKDESGREIVAVPPPDNTKYRFWFHCGLGGNGLPLTHVFDKNIWNTTKGQMVFDSQCVAFQMNDLGPIMDDMVDARLSVKNHNTRSETVRIGFFVESARGLIYSSYDAPELSKGLLELRPGESRQLRLRKAFPGVTDEGNVLWFDVRSAGQPAKLLFRARLMRFHSSKGGLQKTAKAVLDPLTKKPKKDADGKPLMETGYQPFADWLPQALTAARPARTDFDARMQVSQYDKRLFVVVDRGMPGASEEAKSAAEVKLTIVRDDRDETPVREARAAFRGDFATLLVDVPELAEGETYAGMLMLFDKSKRIVGEKDLGKFRYQGGPWKNNRLGLDDVVWEGFSPIEAQGDSLHMKKHHFTVSPQGLPAQIVIRPDPRELPLEKRASGAQLTGAELAAMGRGPQLRGPARLIAVLGGQPVAGEVTQPAKAVRTWKSEVEYRAEMRFGGLPATLVSRYDCDGTLHCRLEYGGDQAVAIDGLELVMPVAGQVDTAFSETGRSGAMAAADTWECSLPDGEGVVWDSTKCNRELAYGRFVPWFWFGSGDRGFTFWCDSSEGWIMDAEGSTLQLQRDQSGQVTMRVRFVNHAAEVQGRRRIDFTLMTHPAKDKPKNYRAAGWHYTLGPAWCAGYWAEPYDLSEEYLQQHWHTAASAPKDLPYEQAASWRKDEPPFHRYGKWRQAQAGFAAEAPELDRLWEDKATYLFERQIRVGRRVGWHMDEYFPIAFGRSDNMAMGNGYLASDEMRAAGAPLPWEAGFLTRHMRDHYKRLARIHQVNNVPQRHQSWSNNEATMLESFWWSSILVEECGAMHRSYDVDVITQFPSPLYRYLAHTASGLATAHMADATFADYGDDKRLDRQIVGRALLHDIGVTPAGPHGIIYHKEDVIRLLSRLAAFGFFQDEGIEKLPYWRNAEVVRIGDRPSTESKVYVTAYRRALAVGKGHEAVLVVLNESPKAIELPLHLVDQQRLLGGANNLKSQSVLERAAVHPSLGQWWSKLCAPGSGVVLMDLESGDEVAAEEGKSDTYGPVYIPYHDFRVFLARHQEN